MKMKAIIIEDEHLAAQQLQRLLGELSPDIEIVAVHTSVKEAKRWLLHAPEPDLVFADIQLNDGLSFEIFQQFNLTCPVIFITAYNEYALRAFKANGIDYLLKPVQEDELLGALAKINRMSHTSNAVHLMAQSFDQLKTNQPEFLYRKIFLVNQRNNSIPVPVSEVALFTLDTIIYLLRTDGQRFSTDFETLDAVEQVLDPIRFFRANRKAIINLDSIDSYRSDTSGKIFVRIKKPYDIETDISREKAPLFRRWIDR
jgi:DNA-binding LytR/AlgR family response regulator